MARLTAADRRHLKSSSYGLPGKRKYPMPDASHARNAKARASEEERKGRISKSEERKIDAKANRKLGKSGSSRHTARRKKTRGSRR